MVAAPTPRLLRLFTADEVWRMVDAGVFGDGEHIELIEGELVTMNPQGPVHANRTTRLRQLLERAYGVDVHVRDHSPVEGTPTNIPEPDLAVVRGGDAGFDDRHPGPADVLLVVEVSSETRRTDRRKAEIYARAGYRSYWVVDLEARRVEVRTEPKAGVYTRADVVDGDGELPLPESGAKLRVADILPAAQR